MTSQIHVPSKQELHVMRIFMSLANLLGPYVGTNRTDHVMLTTLRIHVEYNQ